MNIYPFLDLIRFVGQSRLGRIGDVSIYKQHDVQKHQTSFHTSMKIKCTLDALRLHLNDKHIIVIMG